MTSPWNTNVADMVARQMAMDATTAAQAAAAAAQSASNSAGTRLTACRLGSGKTGVALLAGNSVDVTVAWKTPMPSAVYTVEPVEGPGILGNASLAVKSQTATGCVITVTAQLAVAVGSLIFAHAYV